MINRFFVATFLICLPLISQSNSASKDTFRYESISLTNTQIRHIHSEINGIDYKLYINIPASFYASKRKKYPTLYLLDADYSFPLTKMASEHLSDRNKIDEVLLVGIAYDGPNKYRLNRTRDYTIRNVLMGGYTPEIQKHSGGAKKFKQFIKQELVPYIETSFPVNNSRGIVGHSLGGLFASYALLEDPELFDKYLIISASLWYDNERLLKRSKAMKHFNQKMPHQVFMAIGGKENGGNYRMIDEQNEFLRILNNKQHFNLSTNSQVFDYFDHDMIVPAAISRGLVDLYG